MFYYSLVQDVLEAVPACTLFLALDFFVFNSGREIPSEPTSNYATERMPNRKNRKQSRSLMTDCACSAVGNKPYSMYSDTKQSLSYHLG